MKKTEKKNEFRIILYEKESFLIHFDEQCVLYYINAADGSMDSKPLVCK